MSTLYSLTTAYKAVWGVVESEDTDLATIEEALTSIEDTIAVKAENIALFIKDLDDEAKIIKQEEIRLSARRKAVETKRDGIKSYLLQNMEAMELLKVKTALYTISCSDCPASISITDETLIPDEFLTVIPESYVPRKKDILTAWKNGRIIPGTELIVNRTLRIK